MEKITSNWKLEKIYISQDKDLRIKNSFISIVIPIIIILSGILLFHGCSKPKINPKAHNFLLLLHIQDSYGIDILKEIPNIRSEGYIIVEDKDGWTGEVKSELYNLNIMLPGKSLKMPLWVTKTNYNYFLILNVNNIDQSPDETLTFKLTCSFIFGDNEEHTIITYWDPDGLYRLSDNYPRNECSRIIIDGIEWPVEQILFIPDFSDETKKQLALTNNKSDFTRYISVAKIIL